MLGANECTWGPSHWCASFDNAKNCGPGAIEHCIRTKAVGFVGLTKPIPENVAALVHPGKAPRKPVMFDALRALSEKKLGSVSYVRLFHWNNVNYPLEFRLMNITS